MLGKANLKICGQSNGHSPTTRSPDEQARLTKSALLQTLGLSAASELSLTPIISNLTLNLHKNNKGFFELLEGSAKLTPLHGQASSELLSNDIYCHKTVQVHWFQPKPPFHFLCRCRTGNSLLYSLSYSQKTRILHPAFRTKSGENCKTLQRLYLLCNQNS